ncbi:hypothetical protein [Paenarthrobacter sp. NPDC018779]
MDPLFPLLTQVLGPLVAIFSPGASGSTLRKSWQWLNLGVPQ